MEQEMICTSCPAGCLLRITYHADSADMSVQGNACPRGITYARGELTDPRRTVTTTVAIHHARITMLPVKTAQPVPRDTIEAVLHALKDVSVHAPVCMGDVIVKNVAHTDVDVVAARPAQIFEAEKTGERICNKQKDSKEE